MAHGVEIEYTERSAVEIAARFDTGDPMAGAQVAVFAPDDPAKPWLTGTCDSEGRFFFTPEPEIPGLWEVQVRLAGHGEIIRIKVENGDVAANGTAGLSTGQKLMMVIAVTWGLVGTALFFSGRRS